ncbi:hypothetical protein GCM10009555_094040 [Acrocarpospora macrocephala]|uniref:Uncharacterized protein n=1 Tax=Acrocarpospora macrocephala TaxID=150177 RepID=A0A5M3WU86_9ACTN|nr:hypothetical protein [Acrocarpospora macrocephala]GES11579.1 hypothetical protein Amac_051760 [Acrocarpospora macrocephala]
MSLLEESYRRVLRLLPASYRAKREIVIAGLACVGVHWHSPALRTPSWPLALAILAALVLCARLPGLNFGAVDSITQTMTAVALGQSVAVALIGLVLVVLGTRALLAIPRAAEP